MTEDKLNTKFGVIENPIVTEPLNKRKAQQDGLQIKVYKKRWFILLLYTLFTFGNKCQYFQYTIILNVAAKYYNVSSLAIKATTMVYNLSMPIFIFPYTWLSNRGGLRWTLIIATVLTCIGTWMKYVATSTDRYALMLAGQAINGACQIVILAMPASLAARWFGPKEVATGTGIAFIGPKIGMGAMSMLAPIIVRDHADREDIGNDFKLILLPLAIYVSCVAFLVIIFFEDEPKLPPSKARALQLLSQNDCDFWSTLGRLVRNKDYMLLWASQSLLLGVILTMGSSLNTLYLLHFEDARDVGEINTLIIIGGLTGIVVFSKILDKTKKFKAVSLTLFACAILSFIAMATSFYMGVKWGIYVAAISSGTFTLGYHPVTYELAAELTYPESETLSSSLLVLGHQFAAAVLLAITDKLLIQYNELVMYIFLLCILAVALVLAVLTKDVQRRQAAGCTTLTKPNNNR